MNAARQAYPDAERIEISIFRDEYGEERVLVKAIVADEGDAETARYFHCLSLWTSAIDRAPQTRASSQVHSPWTRARFLDFAFALAHKDARSAGELRTAVSRAYYGLYITAVDFRDKCRVSVVDNQSGHRVVPKALRACGDVQLREVAATLDDLRAVRWEADYVMAAAAPEHAGTVKKHVKHAWQNRQSA